MSTVYLRPYERTVASEDGTWDTINEQVASDSDYISVINSSSMQYFYYKMIPDNAFYGTINYVKMHIRCKTTWGGFAGINSGVYIGTTRYTSGSNSPTESWVEYTYTFNTNPATGLAWTMQNVLSLVGFVGMRGYYDSELSVTTYCSQFYAEVDYTVPSSATIQYDTYIPEGAGSITELTPVGDASNYICVQTSDLSTTYVKTATTSTWKNDLYTISGGCTIGNIQFVKLLMVAYSPYGHTVDGARPTIKTHGTSYYSRDLQLKLYDDSYYVYFWTLWTTNPNTGTAWTTSEINDLEIGLALRTGTASVPPICTQIYVYVAGVHYSGSTKPQIVGLTSW